MNKPSYTLNTYVISKSFSFYLPSFEVIMLAPWIGGDFGNQQNG